MANSQLGLPEPRAGFFRRSAAALIDAIVVSATIQLSVAALFAHTHGAIQTTSGFHLQNCRQRMAIAELPKDLDPAPPTHANSAVICRLSFFGLETARRLTVSRPAEGKTKGESRSYMLDTNDRPTQGDRLDWLLAPAFLIYLTALERCFGTTVGKRLCGLRVVEAADPERSGIPLRKAVVRNVLIWGWTLPAEPWWPGAGLIGIVWILWILIEGDRTGDPISDRIAGTAVLRW
jgi:hypothetical protein